MSASNQNVDSSNAELQRVANLAVEACERRFDSSPSWMAAAPGRVNLIGEHVDYNDGIVLPMAIERYTVVAGVPASQNESVFFAEELGESFSVSTTEAMRPENPSWSNYIRGVLAGFAKRGVDLPPMSVVIVSSVPVGSGLSSSAALEVATAMFLQSVAETDFAANEIALLCQTAEHEFAGVPCGIMDQFSSVFGKKDSLVQLDCRSMNVVHVPFESTDHSILIINSNVQHELSGGEYAERRSQCKNAADKIGRPLRESNIEDLESKKGKLTQIEYRRARHVITEIDRVKRASHGLRIADWSLVGELMNDSHDSLRDDFEVSCRELDLLVELAQRIGPAEGIFGARMTGGGFGGCTVNLVNNAQVDSISEKILSAYQKRSGVAATAFSSRPGIGCQILR